MTGKRNYFLPHSKLQEGWESDSRTQQHAAETLRKSLQKLGVYQRPLPPRESDLAWREDGWMR